MKIELTVTSDKGIALQEYLKENIGIPKSLLHELRMSKEVKVNDKIPVWTLPLQKGDILSIPFLKETITPSATQMEIDVLYEDEHLLIINKKAGIETHPSSEEDTASLSNGVAEYFVEQEILAKVRHIHRLDKNTSGTILFAKHALSGALLDREMTVRKIKRTYLALVEGLMDCSAGIVDKPIGKDRHHAARRRISSNGQKAVTHYKVWKRFPKEKLTLVELSLDTGRTHQIRVHMSSLGHPLYGDTLYGASVKQERHSLHAWKLTVPHPFKEDVITVEAPIPFDFGPRTLAALIGKL
ncbi:RluA family pseudouridine synthase [Sutcliffiella deserti]|uniref:RluA family pseudouridine synthase n=1 Tax=Sutcliffiella deserti TaxID=2875501 RepID=UPI001CC076CB|nr:RluA family pseudouridine synthase [Sutcliffiella deserti]